MYTKNTRLDIRTTKEAKYLLEQAANALGTSLSAFLLEAALAKASKIIEKSQYIYLSLQEAERFVTALENPPEPSKKLKQLVKKYRTI